MIVILFRTRLREDVDRAAYAQRVAEVMAAAETMPGFVSIKDFVADDGERLAVVEFASEPELEAWRDHALHRMAQQEGRERFYAEYRLDVCRPIRESRFVR